MFFFLEPRSYILYHKLVILDFAVPDFFTSITDLRQQIRMSESSIAFMHIILLQYLRHIFIFFVRIYNRPVII